MMREEAEPPPLRAGGKRLPAGTPALLVVAGICAALYVYRPWVVRPFDIWDFREFLPLLRQSAAPLEQFREFLGYYASQGRYNPFGHAALIAQWMLFGENAWGWQLTRFLMMSANLILIWAFCRRLGMSGLGAAAGAILFIGSAPVERGWVQSIGEPQALAALLLAGLVALRFQASLHWVRSTVAIIGFLAVAMLTKEILAILGPVIIALAWSREPDHTFVRPSATRRNIVLGVCAFVLAVVVALVVRQVLHRAEAHGYATSYGTATLRFERFGENLAAIVLPVRTGVGIALGMLYPANLLVLLVVVLGWLARFRREAERRVAGLHLVWIGLIPLIGALVYLPWPKFDRFYGLPFYVGTALLFGCAVTALERGGGGQRALARVAPFLILLYLALAARRNIATADASLNLNVALARALPEFDRYDSVIVAGPWDGPRALFVRGSDLRGYALAMQYADDAHLPVVRDVDCATGFELMQRGLRRTIMVSYSYGCGRFSQPSRRLRAGFVYRDWLTLAPVIDSVAVDLLIPR